MHNDAKIMTEWKDRVGASLILGALLAGTSVGYIGYMGGIGKGDPITYLGVFALPISYAFANSAAQEYRRLTIGLIIATPWIFLLGVRLVFSHPDLISIGVPLVFLANFISLLVLFLGRNLFIRVKALRAALSAYRWVDVALRAVVLLIAISGIANELSMERSPFAMKYKGQGLLNAERTDVSVVWEDDGQYRGYMADAADYRFATKQPAPGRPAHDQLPGRDQLRGLLTDVLPINGLILGSGVIVFLYLSILISRRLPRVPRLSGEDH